MASYLIKGEEGRFMLIECGPLSLLHQLEAAISGLGLEPANLTDILLTHIHLDHSGSAGALVGKSGANVWVHKDGAPHIHDPGRLIASSRRVYGESFDELMKGAEPVPQENILEIQDGDEFELHGRSFRVLHTPGHAGSHVSYLLDGDTLFTGDSAGIRFPGTGFVKPATAPPEVDLDAWLGSILKMQSSGATRILPTHYGEYTDVDRHFRELRRQNARWSLAVLDGLRAGEDDAALLQRVTDLSEAQMEEAGLAEDDRQRLRVSSDHAMTTAGLKRYWQKLHPERLGEVSFPLGRPARIAVLASGRGSNLQALLAAYPAGDLLGSVVLTVSDKPDAGALDLARAAGVPAEHVPWSSRSAFEAELELLLSERHVDLICLAGFMRILSAGFTDRYRGRILNIHPSLLPDFRGLNPQQQALDAGVSEAGCTVHFVDAGVDTGPLVAQARVDVLPGDDAEALSARILEQEHLLYPQAVRKVLKGNN